MKRDLAVLGVAVFALFVSLYTHSAFSVQRAWAMRLDTALFADQYAADAAERLPPPVVADLDGDGRAEVVVATRAPAVRVVRGLGGAGGDAEPAVEHEASLLTNVRVARGRAPVALAVGQAAAGAAEQVVVVVTEDWTVLCFDARLAPLWERTLNHLEQSLHIGRLAHRELSALVTPVPLRRGDGGVVVVGGSMRQMDPVGAGAGKLAVHSDLYGEDGDILSPSRFDAMGHPEIDPELDGWRLGEGREGLKARQERAEHFSLYALDAGSGELRWKHEAGDFFEESASDEVVEPQHQYRIDASALQRHEGEADWRDFRASVVGALPHQWSVREDTRLEPARFARSDSAAGGGVLPNAVVAHTRRGLEAVHLYSGRPLTHLSLPKSSAAGLYADVNGDGIVDHVQAVSGRHNQRLTNQGVRLRSQRTLPSCMMQVVSGVPALELLSNGSLCHRNGEPDYTMGGRRRSREDVQSDDTVLVADPALVAHPDPYNGAHGRSKDLVFAVSSGVVSSYTWDGHLNWQFRAGPHWGGGDAGVVASVTPLGADETHVLVVGDKLAMLLSAWGREAARVELGAAPVSRPAFGDLDGDGVTDFVLVTRDAVRAYRVAHRNGSNVLLMFVVLLLGAIACVLAANASGMLETPEEMSRVARGRRRAAARRSVVRGGVGGGRRAGKLKD